MSPDDARSEVPIEVAVEIEVFGGGSGVDASSDEAGSGGEAAATAAALERLVSQLSSSASPLSADQLAALASHEACTLLVARRSSAGEIVGAMVLVMFPLLTGLRAWIEDVVVDESVRNQGIGELLNHRAIEIATAAGARSIDLTSRPSRAAANRLYKRLGFSRRETNMYRLELN